MPVAPTDAFRESAKKDFIESPNHERNDEAGLTLADGTARYYVGVTMKRTGFVPSTALGLSTRERDDAIFLKRETTWENTNDPASGSASSMTLTEEYTIYGELITYSFSGSATSPDVSSWTVVSTTVISDDDNEAHAVVVYTNGTNTHTITEKCTMPVLPSDIFDIIIPFYETKFAAATVPAGGFSGELWSPDTSGTFTSVWTSGLSAQKLAASSTYSEAFGRVGVYDEFTYAGFKEVVSTYPTTALLYRIQIQTDDFGSITMTIPSSSSVDYLLVNAGTVYEVEPSLSSYHNRDVLSRKAASPPP